MGLDKKRKKQRKISDRKFMFEWDTAEDTSNDINPLYKNRHNAQFFGRGLFAGIDIKEQKKNRAHFYDSIVKERRTEEELQRAK